MLDKWGDDQLNEKKKSLAVNWTETTESYRVEGGDETAATGRDKSVQGKIRSKERRRLREGGHIICSCKNERI